MRPLDETHMKLCLTRGIVSSEDDGSRALVTSIDGPFPHLRSARINHNSRKRILRRMELTHHIVDREGCGISWRRNALETHFLKTLSMGQHLILIPASEHSYCVKAVRTHGTSSTGPVFFFPDMALFELLIVKMDVAAVRRDAEIGDGILVPLHSSWAQGNHKCIDYSLHPARS